MPRVYNRNGLTRVPHDAVYVGRGSPYGNPYTVNTSGGRANAIKLFEEWLRTRPDLLTKVRAELAGKNLVCYCAPAKCHADVLMRIANDELPL